MSVTSIKEKNKAKVYKTSLKPTSYRWLVFALLMGVYVIGLFLRLCLGVVRADLELDFALSAQAFGTLGGAFFYAYMLLQFPAGMLTDSWGPKRTAVSGGLLMLFGTLVFAWAPNLTCLLIGRFLSGMGGGLVFIPVQKVCALWFKEEEFGAVNGLINCLGYCGGIVAQGPLAYLVKLYSWRVVFLALAALLLIILLADLRWVHEKPEEVGLEPIPGSDSSRRDKALTGREAWQGLKHVLCQKRSWPPTIVALGLFGSYNALTGIWGTSYVSDIYGKSALEASSSMSFALVGIALGSLLITGWSQRLKSRRLPIQVCCGVLAVCWFLLIANSSGFIPFTVLQGLFFVLGFCHSCIVIDVVAMKETHLTAYTGIAVSTYNTGCFLGATVASPIMGALLSWAGGGPGAYRWPFGFCFLLILSSFICSFFIRETGCRNRGEEFEAKG